MNNKKWLTISYEGLISNYSGEMNRINHRFNYGLHDLGIDVKKPNKSTKENRLQNLRNGEQLSSWKMELSKNQIHTILDVLEKFEIDIYPEKFEPDYGRLYTKVK